MKKLDSWNSEFRKKRFYERQALKQEEKLLQQFSIDKNLRTPKTIAVMLDIAGTSDFINDEKANLFIRKLEFIRKKFKADIGTISISTHYNNPNTMQGILEILSRNLLGNIKIGINFYYGGTYDYDKKINTPREYGFNSSKINTFDSYYISNNEINNLWFAIIDDGISEDTYKKYQHNHPMLLCRPSQRENSLKYNNFMSISTITKGFDGVIEVLDIYINSIKNLSSKQILAKQSTMINHLASYELFEKIRNKDYSFLKKYFSEGFADTFDYTTTLNGLLLNPPEQKLSISELKNLKVLLDIISQQFELNEEKQNIEKVKMLQQIIKKN